MLWEVELCPLGDDAERDRVCNEFDLITNSNRGQGLIARAARGFLLEGPTLTEDDVAKLTAALLIDSIVERACVWKFGAMLESPVYTVLLKSGVMDPTAESVLKAAGDLNVPLSAVRPQPMPTVLEFHADAGAPEGALYVDGKLIGWLSGVKRL